MSTENILKFVVDRIGVCGIVKSSTKEMTEMQITVYRDTPKRGETDAKWCYYVSSNGHIVKCDIGFETEAAAREAARAYS